MLKTEKLVNIKRNSRSVLNVVREHYLRNDIPCKSQRCQYCEKIPGINLLPSNGTHYLMPSWEVVQKYHEILFLEDITGIIMLQTVLNVIQQNGKRLYKQINDLVKNPSKESVIFTNEFHSSCYIERTFDDDLEDWRIRNIYNAASWYHEHFENSMPIIILTENEKFKQEYGNQTTGIFVLTIEEYIMGFWHDLTEAHDLLESLNAVGALQQNKGVAICKRFQEYYPAQVLQAGIKSGRFYSSYLKVNKHNPIKEAFVQIREGKSIQSGSVSDILIPGTAYRNRAIDGDLVVVEVLSEEHWCSRSSSITEKSEETFNLQENSNIMMTGRIVGILQRNLRDFVVSLPIDMESSVKRNSEKILTIPWDARIPKIRISTRQANRLKNDRFIVRIDSWEINSLYPNGHFVKSLGLIGDIETEISAILVEHALTKSTFSEGIMKEMPLNTKENPWIMESSELERRKDLRNSHLIFSIDPIGCEDVDDTLSIRKLGNGITELGVHIADVTHFVKPNSLTDLEARSKTTTVYLADRRYDMLPEVLSAQLCSLISGVDRYAVSVIWQLDENYEVIDVWYGRTIIRSKYKLYYEAAQKIGDDMMSLNEALETIPELYSLDKPKQKESFQQLKHSVKLLMNIARKLKAKRAKNGAVDLESTEVQIHVGNEKEIKEVAPKKPLEVHETIAECMIFANHWVAKKIKEYYKNNALLRNHPVPKQDFFSSLKDCAKAKGFKVNTSSNQLLGESLDQCTDSDPNFNKILRMLATQAMMVASYFSTGSVDKDLFCHYGLALDSYTHFTSPIRRYADVIVHRLLLASVGDKTTDSTKLLGNQELQELCNHINIKHREADHAQKDSVKLFQAMFFKQHSDDKTCVVDAMVYNLRNNGVLVFIPRYGIKGAVILKNRSGLVACSHDENDVQFVKGQFTKYAEKVVVTATTLTQTVQLFSYLKVRINVITSRNHSETLRLDLVSYNTSTNYDTNDKQFAKKQLVQDVKDTETQRKVVEDELEKKLSNNTELSRRYGQTHKSVSLYELFQSFKKTALLEKKR